VKDYPLTENLIARRFWRPSMKPHHDVHSLKQKLPLPDLLHALGRGQYARRICPSPLRKDAHPSWGIYARNGHWHFKDLATGDGGDEITFLARWLGLDEKRDFQHILEYYAQLAGTTSQPPGSRIVSVMDFADEVWNLHCFGKDDDPDAPDFSGFKPFWKPDQLERLAALRGLTIEGLNLATQTGVLLFNEDWHGHEVWAVADSTERVIELRRLDGLPFPAIGTLPERKSHALRHSQKSWPLNVLEAEKFRCIALVEGGPDFLACFDLVLHDQALWRVAPVCMLGASSAIAQEALQFFKGKTIRIYPHQDKAGLEAARRWQRQLRAADADRVDIYDFGGLVRADGQPVNDLNDFLQISLSEFAANPDLQTILPK
jgi:hypothetical protein